MIGSLFLFFLLGMALAAVYLGSLSDQDRQKVLDYFDLSKL